MLHSLWIDCSVMKICDSCNRDLYSVQHAVLLLLIDISSFKSELVRFSSAHALWSFLEGVSFPPLRSSKVLTTTLVVN